MIDERATYLDLDSLEASCLCRCSSTADLINSDYRRVRLKHHDGELLLRDIIQAFFSGIQGRLGFDCGGNRSFETDAGPSMT